MALIVAVIRMSRETRARSRVMVDYWLAPFRHSGVGALG
jgi:hypothetical protein